MFSFIFPNLWGSVSYLRWPGFWLCGDHLLDQSLLCWVCKIQSVCSCARRMAWCTAVTLEFSFKPHDLWTRLHLPIFPLFSFSAFISGQFIKTLQEYEVVDPARVDANGHFVSFNLHHHISNTRKRRDLGKKENAVYYKINHKEKDLFFNLTIHMGFLSHNYVVERRRGNHSRAKIAMHSGVPCHFIGSVLQPGSGSGTAAISTCDGLVSDVGFWANFGVIGTEWSIYIWMCVLKNWMSLSKTLVTHLSRRINLVFWVKFLKKRNRRSKAEAEDPWELLLISWLFFLQYSELFAMIWSCLNIYSLFWTC